MIDTQKEGDMNISVLCTFRYFNKFRFYKYYAALPLQILQCAAPYVIFLKLVLQMLRGSAATNIAVRCTLGYLFEIRFYKYYGALHLTLSF
jgi:hypothetical protein